MKEKVNNEDRISYTLKKRYKNHIEEDEERGADILPQDFPAIIL